MRCGGRAAICAVMLCLLSAVGAAGKSVPVPSAMAVSRTPFTDRGAVDFESISQMTALYHKISVDVVFVNGGMSQFQQLSVEERKAIVQAWTDGIRANNSPVYVVGNVAPAMVELGFGV